MALGETDHQALYLGTCWAILGLALLFCCARYYVKFVMMRKPTADDIILFLTILGMVTSMILWTLQTKYALGRHVWNVTPDDFSIALKLFYAACISYTVASSFAKIAIILQYIRIFHLFPVFVWTCWTMLVLVLIWMLGTLLAAIAFCKVDNDPRWSPKTVSSQCQIKTWLAHAGISMAFDIVLIVLPIPLVSKMQIPRKQKLLTLGLFAIGSAGVVFSIIRIVAFTNQEAPSNDPSYDSIYTPLWVALEGFISLMCAAAMAIRPLLAKFIPSLEGPNVHRARAPPRRILGGQRGEMEEWQQPQGQARLNFIRVTLSRVSQRISEVVTSRGDRLHLGSADDEEAGIVVGEQRAPRREVEVKEKSQREAIEVEEHARSEKTDGDMTKPSGNSRQPIEPLPELGPVRKKDTMRKTRSLDLARSMP